jgi:hypothetical protein
MPLDHYMPAAFIASFAEQIALRRRESVIEVGDVLTGKSFQSKAGSIGAQHNFYTLQDPVTWSPSKQPNLRLIDDVWQAYEGDLTEALDDLRTGNLTALRWARTLVPFVAAMLVRGPDFNRRFESRPVIEAVRDAGRADLPIPDNTHGARLIELQRLLGSVAAADWIVSTIGDDGKLITNDVGHVPTQDKTTGQLGILIPLSSQSMLTVLPNRQNIIAIKRLGTWYPNIRYMTVGRDWALGINNLVAFRAQRFVYGENKTLIAQAMASLPRQHTPGRPIEPADLGFLTGIDAVVHEFTWHRLISFLMNPSHTEANEQFDIDWNLIALGWHPPVMFALNLPMFPTALRRSGDVLAVDFYDGVAALQAWSANQ